MAAANLEGLAPGETAVAVRRAPSVDHGEMPLVSPTFDGTSLVNRTGKALYRIGRSR
jgi:hypothetical protein